MPKFMIEEDIPGAGNLTRDEPREISQLSCRVLSNLSSEIHTSSEKCRSGIALLIGGPTNRWQPNSKNFSGKLSTGFSCCLLSNRRP